MGRRHGRRPTHPGKGSCAIPLITRQNTVAHHLVQGGLSDLKLNEATQKDGRPAAHDEDGFAVRSYRAPDGTPLTVAGAYGPDWLTTRAEIRNQLERTRYTVTDEAPGLGSHELLVQWATPEETKARNRAAAARRAQERALERRQAAEKEAADGGQASLF